MTHRRLQKAHAEQAAFIQSFQSEKAKVDAYKTTISMQEKVIYKLEHIVDAKLKEICRQQAADAQAARRQIDQLKTESAQAVGSLAAELKYHEVELRAQEDRLRDSQVAKDTVKSAFLIEAKDEKIKALEDELVASATESSREIARLNLRVYELEVLQASEEPLGEQAPNVELPAHW